MLIGVVGQKGSGKTLFQSILGNYIHVKTGLPLRANYELANSEPVLTTRDIWKLRNEIFCFDELWITMDGRFWKENAELTYWIMQIRHRDILVIYTAQHRSEIEKRVRLATDLFVISQKIKKDNKLIHKYTFLEPDLMSEDTFTIGKSYLIYNPEKFYNLYNTKELIWQIKHVKMSFDEIQELSAN